MLFFFHVLCCISDLYFWLKLDADMRGFLLYPSCFLDSCTLIDQSVIQAIKGGIQTLSRPLELCTHES